MRIGFLAYSTPFKWIDNTSIAHNKIWSWLVMEMARHGGFSLRMLSAVDTQTNASMGRYGCKKSTDISDIDCLILFCGYFTPVVVGSAVLHTLETLRKFTGTVVYITCDYLLQFNPSVRRYGAALRGWPEDALVNKKTWNYVLNSEPEYHFKTKQALANFMKFPNLKRWIVVPELNMAGVAPDWQQRVHAPVTPQRELLYCGAFRPNREDFFKRYFCQPESSGWVISTSRAEKFLSLPGFHAQVCPPLSGKIWNAIASSHAQIIGCDTVDAPSPHTPLPTRYWEAVSAGVPVFFDRGTCSKWKSLATTPHRFVSDAATLKRAISQLKANPKLRAFIVDEQAASLYEGAPFYERWNVAEWLP